MNPSSFAERILARGISAPDRTIIQSTHSELTAFDLHRLVLRLTKALDSIGLGRGDRVAVVPTLRAEALAVRSATALLGCPSVFCPNTGVPAGWRDSWSVHAPTSSSCSRRPPPRRRRSPNPRTPRACCPSAPSRERTRPTSPVTRFVGLVRGGAGHRPGATQGDTLASITPCNNATTRSGSSAQGDRSGRSPDGETV